MVETNFTYTNELLKKINSNATKRTNLICEIMMLIILAGTTVLFVTKNYILGGIFAGIFVLLAISLFYTNKSIERANLFFVDQNVKIVFNETDMNMTTSLGDRELNSATIAYDVINKVVERNGLIYFYIKKSAIVVPRSSFKTNEQCEQALQLVGDNYMV